MSEERPTETSKQFTKELITKFKNRMKGAKRMKKKENDRDATAIRLDAIIRLLAENLVADNKMSRNGVYYTLRKIGLSQQEIATIFNRKSPEIGSAIAKYKDKQKGG